MNKTFFHKLESLRDQGHFTQIDIEFCRFLSEVEPEIHKDVLLAAGLVSSAYGRGDVCISLNDFKNSIPFDNCTNKILKAPKLKDWLKLLIESSVVGKPGDFKPLIMDDSHRLYLHKLWIHEQNIATFIHERIDCEVPDVDIELLKEGIQRLFKDSQEQPDWQK